MAKTNYSFEKRQKELAKKKKKEEKRKKKLAADTESAEVEHAPLADDKSTPVDDASGT